MARPYGQSKASLVRLGGVGLAGLGLVLAGCVSNPNATPPANETSTTVDADAEIDPASIISAAGEKTFAAGTARIQMSGSTDANGGTSGLVTAAGSFTMEGSIDFENGSSDVRVTPGSTGKAGEVRIVTVNDVQYVHMGRSGSDDWLEKGTRDPGTGALISVPLNYVNVLQNISDPVGVGPDKVGGVETVKYTGVSELEPALDGAGIPVSRSDVDAVVGDAEISVWIDEQGRIVKTEHRANAQVGRTEILTEITSSLSDFGVDLDIQAPKSDEAGG
jgi:hypothetical protein